MTKRQRMRQLSLLATVRAWLLHEPDVCAGCMCEGDWGNGPKPGARA